MIWRVNVRAEAVPALPICSAVKACAKNTNGDYLCSLSSSPSPERIDESFLDDAEECSRVAKRIEAAKPDLLFVGLGAPKQEYWIERYAYLPAKVIMGIGGSSSLLPAFVSVRQ